MLIKHILVLEKHILNAEKAHLTHLGLLLLVEGQDTDQVLNHVVLGEVPYITSGDSNLLTADRAAEKGLGLAK